MEAEKDQPPPTPNLSLPVPRYCPTCNDQILAELYYRSEEGELTVEHCRTCQGAWVSQSRVALWQRLLRPHRAMEAPPPLPDAAPPAATAPAPPEAPAPPAERAATAAHAVPARPTAASPSPPPPVEEPARTISFAPPEMTMEDSPSRLPRKLILIVAAVCLLFLGVRFWPTDTAPGTGQAGVGADRKAQSKQRTTAASGQLATTPAEDSEEDADEETAAGESATPADEGPTPPQTAPRGEIAAIGVTNPAGRSGVFYLPKEPEDRAIPLLVLLHDTGGSGRQIAERLTALADRHGFAVLAPDSGLPADGSPGWDVGNAADETPEDTKHTMACVRALEEMEGVFLDSMRVLIAGYSGGGTAALNISSHESLFSAFAVLHGAVDLEGLGSNQVRGWLSTGARDEFRPSKQVQADIERLDEEGYSELEFREFGGGHELTPAELEDLVRWWLGD